MDGEMLRAWRTARGLSQLRLAQLLGVHEITVTRWERGTRAIPEMLVMLALEALDARLAAAPAQSSTDGEAPSERS